MSRRPPRPTRFPYTTLFLFFNDTATTEIYTLSLHDALPIFYLRAANNRERGRPRPFMNWPDRKSTRLNSSHLGISYAVFCLKKKKKPQYPTYSSRATSSNVSRQSVHTSG